MISDGTNCYQYNDANKMTKLTRCITGKVIAEYVYDFNGNRMIKKNYTNGTLANTVYSWTDAFETKVISGEGTESTSYYFVNNELVAKKDNSGTKTYIHPDHLGSASLVTNAAGTLVERTTYDAWGEVLSGATKSKFQYTGQEKDLESGLNYYNARYYDSHIRRFTQPDPIIQDIYNPQNLNRYSYVLNNPLRYTDPTGNFSISGIINSVISFVSNLFIPKPAPQAKTTSSSSSVQNKSIPMNKSTPTNNANNNMSSKPISTPNNSLSINSGANALVKGMSSTRFNNNINSAGICWQASFALGSGGGGGGTCALCLIMTKNQGLVFSGSAGGVYVPAGLSGGEGPALMFSNASNANELGGTDIYAGGSLKALGGLQVDHSRSVNPGNIGIWSTTINPQLGAGADVHVGVSQTAVFDIPGF